MSRLRRLWLDVNSSLWFVPALMVLAALATAYGLVHLDDYLGNDWKRRHPLLFGAGADGARGMLAAIAGSMITVAGLTFSLTLSTLAQVANHYTSRLLRTFMRDRPNQVVMGSFVSIFAYCLAVLRTIRGGDEGAFVPSLAVAFALVLALVSIGMLIFFIHHIATALQAANIIGASAEETLRTFDVLFPTGLGEPASPAAVAAADLPDLRWQPVPARESGYVQGIDEDDLLAYATGADVVLRMEQPIGSFVTAGSPLVAVAAAAGAAPAALPQPAADRLHRAYSIGRQRTGDQDAGFGLRQLVDIALKALSPGSIDTSTAVMCVDWLGVLLSQLADRDLGRPARADDAGRVRVLAVRPDFAGYLGTALDQIRTAAAKDLAVYLRLLAVLGTVAGHTTRPDRRAALRHHATLTWEAVERNLTVPQQLEQARARYQATLLALA